MTRPNTPHTARPLYATGSAAPFYDYATTPTPRATEYNHTLIYNPPSPSPRRAAQLPPVSPESVRRWTRLRSINNPVQMSHYSDTLPKGLNVNAPAFHPGQPLLRPNSALSGSSSRSSRSSTRSTSSSMSWNSSTSATSVSVVSSAAPSAPWLAPPSNYVFPDVKPEERVYKAYRDQLRRTSDVSATISEILTTGVASYQQAQHVALQAARLSAHAPCGREEFQARLRVEALEMFATYWQSDNGPWRTERNAESQYLTSRGVNIAGFMGSLYLHKLISGNDAHRCLDTLLFGRPHFLKLQALHALIVHCGARICAGKTGEYTAILRGRLEARGADGQLVWGPHDESHALLEDLFDNLDRWLSSYEMEQIMANAAQFSAPSATDRAALRNKHTR